MLQHLKNIILEQTKKKERKKREAHFSFSAPSHPEGGHVQVASQKESGTELDISLLFLKKKLDESAHPHLQAIRPDREICPQYRCTAMNDSRNRAGKEEEEEETRSRSSDLQDAAMKDYITT